MNSHSVKYMSSALLLLLSSQANFSGAQEYNKIGTSASSELPMATVIYNDQTNNDQLQHQETPVYKNQAQYTEPSVISEPSDLEISAPESEAVVNQTQVTEVEEIGSDGRVFGYRNGYLHASLGVNGEWR
ncbi:MAG: hypothetical protein D3922_15850, partial [Candidatus Electrothrix sp. AR1]|nr:hypothetical protein [Candidatus Electrothrix sp. AR1]